MSYSSDFTNFFDKKVDIRNTVLGLIRIGLAFLFAVCGFLLLFKGLINYCTPKSKIAPKITDNIETSKSEKSESSSSSSSSKSEDD